MSKSDVVTNEYRGTQWRMSHWWDSSWMEAQWRCDLEWSDNDGVFWHADGPTTWAEVKRRGIPKCIMRAWNEYRAAHCPEHRFAGGHMCLCCRLSADEVVLAGGK